MSLLEHRDRARISRWAVFNVSCKLSLSSLVLILAVVITLWLLLVPMLLLVLNSIRTGPPSSLAGPWTLRNYYVLFSNPFFHTALVNTVIISVISTRWADLLLRSCSLGSSSAPICHSGRWPGSRFFCRLPYRAFSSRFRGCSCSRPGWG